MHLQWSLAAKDLKDWDYPTWGTFSDRLNWGTSFCRLLGLWKIMNLPWLWAKVFWGYISGSFSSGSTWGQSNFALWSLHGETEPLTAAWRRPCFRSRTNKYSLVTFPLKGISAFTKWSWLGCWNILESKLAFFFSGSPEDANYETILHLDLNACSE